MLLSALSKSILMVDPTLSGAQIDFNRPQTVSYILWCYCNLFFWYENEETMIQSYDDRWWNLNWTIFQNIGVTSWNSSKVELWLS